MSTPALIRTETRAAGRSAGHMLRGAFQRFPVRRVLPMMLLHAAFAAAANYLAFWLRFDGRIPPAMLDVAWRYLPILVVVRAVVFVAFGLNRSVWRYTGIDDLRDIIGACAAGSVIFYLLVRSGAGFASYPRSVYVIDALLIVCMTGGAHLAPRVYRRLRRPGQGERVLIFGAGEASDLVLRRLEQRDAERLTPVGLVDENGAQVGSRIHGLPVLGTPHQLPDIIDRQRPDLLLIASPSAGTPAARRLARELEAYGLPIKTVPEPTDVFDYRPKGSDRVYLSPPDVGGDERRAIVDAFLSDWIAPLGPDVDGFEAELAGKAGVRHAVALSSGTAALHLALHILGVSNDDEVLTSTLTFAATANAIAYVGAKPVFLDVDAGTWTLDADLLAEELEQAARRGKLPKAIVTVDLYGQCADYDRISALSRRYGIPLVEDAAEALGASYRGRPAGSFGRVAAFSFNGNKIITTSGGGMLVTDDRPVAERARFLATQAREPAAHYEHRAIGFNYRMSNLLAALGREQLRTLERKVQARRATNAFYRRALADLPGISFMPEAEYGQTNGWLTCIVIDPDAFGADREALRLHLERADIEARPVWKPMHLQPVFAGCRTRGGAVAAGLFERGLCLPSGSSLTDADRDRVAARIHDIDRRG